MVNIISYEFQINDSTELVERSIDKLTSPGTSAPALAIIMEKVVRKRIGIANLHDMFVLFKNLKNINYKLTLN